MKKILNLVVNNFPLLTPVIAVGLTVIAASNGADFEITLLQNLVVWCIGAQCLWGATGHLLMADKVAKGIGWPTGSPFQRELGFVTLGLGIAGIIANSFSEGYWLALIIVYSAFLLGAGFGHIYEAIKHGNRNKYNSGFILYTDIIIPLVLLGLYWDVYLR